MFLNNFKVSMIFRVIYLNLVSLNDSMIYLKIRYLTIQCNNCKHYFQFKGFTIAQCCILYCIVYMSDILLFIDFMTSLVYEFDNS